MLDRAAPTGVALIIVDAEGENMIVVAPGANAELHDPQPRDGAVLCQLEIPADAVALARPTARNASS